jgi:chorismate synthase
MAFNSFGHRLVLTTFGESHGPAIGGVLDGIPAGLSFDAHAVQQALDRRRPGQSALTTQRNEPDRLELLSGVFQGKTLGTPIAWLIRNHDAKSEDYDALAGVFRPGHADQAWQNKYGIRDHRGGGRSSARETAVRVAAGAIAGMLLRNAGIQVTAYTAAIGDVSLDRDWDQVSADLVDSNAVRCPDNPTAARMEALIETARGAGDSLGGSIVCVCRGIPPGLGEPIYGKLQAWLAYGLLTIPASKGFEMIGGFANAGKRGSETNRFRDGISGGITTGDPLVFRVAFKPVSSISRAQASDDGESAAPIEITGRHDPCVIPRAVPVVEAMASLVLADFYLLAKTNAH